MVIPLLIVTKSLASRSGGDQIVGNFSVPILVDVARVAAGTIREVYRSRHPFSVIAHASLAPITQHLSLFRPPSPIGSNGHINPLLRHQYGLDRLGTTHNCHRELTLRCCLKDPQWPVQLLDSIPLLDISQDGQAPL